MFAMLGLADRDTSPVAWSANVGLSARGLIPGYYYNSVQEPTLDPPEQYAVEFHAGDRGVLQLRRRHLSGSDVRLPVERQRAADD